jgi:hypothetical protein
MKEKGERGNRGGGLVRKRENGRGVLAKWPSSSPGSHPRQRQGGSGGGGPPASRPRLQMARGGKEGGRRGGSSPSLTLGRGGARRWLHGRRQTGGGGAKGRRCSCAQPRGEGGRGDAWRPGERPVPFIGGGRRFGRGFFELGKL